MSVLKNLRNESPVLFITTAEDLRTFTALTVTKLSQKYKDLGNIHAYNLAQSILDDLIRANSLYFTKDNTTNFQTRRNYFDRALGNLNCLSSHIVYLCDLADAFEKNDKNNNNKKPKITDKRWLKWASLINKTRELVVKIRDSDLTRYKESAK